MKSIESQVLKRRSELFYNESFRFCCQRRMKISEILVNISTLYVIYRLIVVMSYIKKENLTEDNKPLYNKPVRWQIKMFTQTLLKLSDIVARFIKGGEVTINNSKRQALIIRCTAIL